MQGEEKIGPGCYVRTRTQIIHIALGADHPHLQALLFQHVSHDQGQCPVESEFRYATRACRTRMRQGMPDVQRYGDRRRWPDQTAKEHTCKT